MENNMEYNAILSEDKEYRYMLSRTWNKNKKIIMFVWLNPSTADDKINDPTITRCINYTKEWWYWWFIMCNLFAYRSTNPNNMKKYKNPIWKDNDKYIELYYNKTEKVICMWWNHWNFMMQSKNFKEKYKEKLFFLEKNKSWEPKHLLYSKSNLKPRKFEN